MYKSLIPGLLNPCVYYLILFEAYNRLPAQEAQVLNYSWIIVLSLLSIVLLKQAFRWIDMIALIMSFIGVLIIATQGRVALLKLDNPWGTVLALSSSIVWASYWIINMKDNRKADIKLFFNFLNGMIFIIVIACLFYRKEIFNAQFVSVNSIRGIIGAIYVGVFEMGLTFLLWLKALENAKNTSSIANLVFFTPFISLYIINIFLHEKILLSTIVGLVLIIIANVVQKSYRRLF